MSRETFTLLLTASEVCRRCEAQATHVLIGREEEFLGFYCYYHGELFRDKLEIKFQFERENQWQRKNQYRKRVQNAKKNSKQKEKGKSFAQISAETRAGLKRIPVVMEKWCKGCGKSFSTVRDTQVYCTTRCFQENWNKNEASKR